VIRGEQGQELVEYTVLVALLAIMILALAGLIGTGAPALDHWTRVAGPAWSN
jgi:Flp pilus assembly pilin Flp